MKSGETSLTVFCNNITTDSIVVWCKNEMIGMEGSVEWNCVYLSSMDGGERRNAIENKKEKKNRNCWLVLG